MNPEATTALSGLPMAGNAMLQLVALAALVIVLWWWSKERDKDRKAESERHSKTVDALEASSERAVSTIQELVTATLHQVNTNTNAALEQGRDDRKQLTEYYKNNVTLVERVTELAENSQEVSGLVIASQARIEEMIRTNQSCPLRRPEILKGHANE